MSEQLELFDQGELFDVKAPDELSSEKSEPENKSAPVSPKTDDDGMVTVWVGIDDELTSQAKAKAKSLGLDFLSSVVIVVWNKRMRTAAGRAFYKELRIELNVRLQLLESPKKEEEIEQTFLHELAHLVAHERNKRKRIQPHGSEWKQACADLGIPGEDRCHDLGFAPRRMKRKFGYKCPNCEVVVSRVHRMKRAAACLACCREHSGGRFDSRFLLVEHRI